MKQAVSLISIVKWEKRGAESKISLEDKIVLILIKHLIHKSNRNMSFMLVLFACLNDIDISYKTIERMYSDSLIRIALSNLHILMLEKRGIMNVDACGDGTGYTVRIHEHYASTAQKMKDGAKINTKDQKFIYSFAILDITSRMYIGFGMSLKSEKQAFLEAIKMVNETGIHLNSLRLDRYFSAQYYADLCKKNFGKVKLYIVPKSNIAHMGLGSWSKNVVNFVKNTKVFLKEYFQRNQSESAFSEDKKRTGWKISQKIPVRVDTANIINYIWHNLSWLGAEV